jgi:AcrR family transcriptional regulator
MKSTRPSKNAPYHHGDLRRALLEAALELLVEGGPDAVSLRDVAKRAGVSHAAPYRHFVSKDAMLRAIAQQGFAALRGHLEAAAAKRRDPLGRFEAMGFGYVAFARAHPGELKLMFRPRLFEPDGAESLEKRSSAFGILVDAIVACQEAGIFRRGDARPMAFAAWSMVHGFSMLLLEGTVGVLPEKQVQALLRAAIETLGRGFRPDPASDGERI